MAENSFVPDFLSLNDTDMKTVLTEENSDFGRLSPKDQDTVISELREDSAKVQNSFKPEKTEKKEDGFSLPSIKQVFDFTRTTVEGGAVVAGGFFGGVPGAGIAGLQAKQFFRGVEEILGSESFPGGTVEGFEKTGPIKLEIPTAGQLSEKFAEVGSDLGISSGEEVLGRVISKVPAEVPAAIAGAITGAVVSDDHPVLGAITGGATLATVVALIKRTGLTDKGALKVAEKRFKEAFKGTPEMQAQIDKNMLEGRLLQDKIPDLKFGLGELLDSPSALTLQKSMSDGAEGINMSTSERVIATRALERFYSKEAIKTGEPGAFIKEVAKAGDEFQAATKAAEDTVAVEVGRLKQVVQATVDDVSPGQRISQNILDKINVKKDVLRKQISDEFSRIPNLKVDPSPLGAKIAQVRSEILKGEDLADIPKAAIRLIEKTIFKTKPKLDKPLLDSLGRPLPPTDAAQGFKTIDIKTARGLNRSLNNQINKATKGVQPNNLLARRLRILKEGINEAFDLTAKKGGQEGIDALQKANSLRVQLAQKFEQGTVGDVLRGGPKGEETRIALANIASEFNSDDGIDALIVALGDKETAKVAMLDFYRMDLINKQGVVDQAGKINTKALASWVNKNITRLRKLGIAGEFKNTQKLQQALESSISRIDVFNKSVAGRVLEASPDTFISNAFKGTKTKDSAKVARELLRLTRGNKAAQEGLKKSMAQHLQRVAETKTPGFFQSTTGVQFDNDIKKFTGAIKDLQPALREIYRNDTERLAAIRDAQRGFQFLSRTILKPIEEAEETLLETAAKGAIAVTGAASPRTAFAAKNLDNMLEKWGQKNIHKYLRQAVFDPDYAKVIFAPKGRTFSSKMFDRLMVNLLNQTGAVDKSSDEIQRTITSSLANPIPPSFSPEQTISQGQ